MKKGLMFVGLFLVLSLSVFVSAQICVDTDPNNDPLIVGEHTNGTNTYVDICGFQEGATIVDKNRLKQYYCDGNNIKILEDGDYSPESDYYTCYGDCFEGKCIESLLETPDAPYVEIVFPVLGYKIKSGEEIIVKWESRLIEKIHINLDISGAKALGRITSHDAGDFYILDKNSDSLTENSFKLKIPDDFFRDDVISTSLWTLSVTGYNNDLRTAIDVLDSEGEVIRDIGEREIKNTDLCRDSDRGINYFEKGQVENTLAFSTEIKTQEDFCYRIGEVIEHYCSERTDYSGKRFTEVLQINYLCPNGCEDGACIGEKTGSESDMVEIEEAGILEESVSCDDNECLFYNICYPLGYRTSEKYCALGNEFVSQLESDSQCDNSFECSSNVCVNNQCVSGNLIQRIFNWFARLFG